MDFFLRVEVVKNFGKEAELFLPFFDEVAVAAPLTGASTPGPGGFAVWRGSATVWLVQVIHINVGKKKGPSSLGPSPFNKKIRLCAAAQNLGTKGCCRCLDARWWKSRRRVIGRL